LPTLPPQAPSPCFFPPSLIPFASLIPAHGTQSFFSVCLRHLNTPHNFSRRLGPSFPSTFRGLIFFFMICRISATTASSLLPALYSRSLFPFFSSVLPLYDPSVENFSTELPMRGPFHRSQRPSFLALDSHPTSTMRHCF